MNKIFRLSEAICNGTALNHIPPFLIKVFWGLHPVLALLIFVEGKYGSGNSSYFEIPLLIIAIPWMLFLLNYILIQMITGPKELYEYISSHSIPKGIAALFTVLIIAGGLTLFGIMFIILPD